MNTGIYQVKFWIATFNETGGSTHIPINVMNNTMIGFS